MSNGYSGQPDRLVGRCRHGLDTTDSGPPLVLASEGRDLARATPHRRCVALRFGWGGLAGPPFPVWSIDYLIGAAGIFLTYVGFIDRRSA
jgi:hypothetical protein